MKHSLLFLWLAASAFAQGGTNLATFNGTWQWRFTMPDGTELHPKLKLKQDGARLTGSSTVRPGTEIAITNGVITGDDLQFEVVRARHETTITTRYAGKREGDVIRGKVESNWSGEPRSYPWEARRLSGIEGTWKWTSTFAGRRFESKITLQLDGDNLTGTMPERGGRPSVIKNASFKEGEIYFEVERGRGDFKYSQTYQGKLAGDAIQGTIESTFGGTPRTVEWNAQREE